VGFRRASTRRPGQPEVQVASSSYFPYTRPFIYPNYNAGLGYLSASGAPPAIYGNNFSNYFSAAQRQDGLAYLNYDWHLGDHSIEAGVWYEHNNSAQGRRWYPFSGANNDLTPYDIPSHPAFTQAVAQGNSSCWGRASVISNHGALDPT
jgi:hypothetical protein